MVVDQICHNSPSADQVAAIEVEGNNDFNIPYDRNFIVPGRDGHTNPIKPYFGCYDPLQYPLFFPYGDNGWQQHNPKFMNGSEGINSSSDRLVYTDFSAFNDVVVAENHGVCANNSKMVSCREYYCYKFQIINNHTSALLYGDRLFQQFIVDTYIKIETTRLDYYIRNQSDVRSELYQGIVDSVVSGEVRGSQIGNV